MKFYTWKDIERYCLKHKAFWEKKYSNIEFYPNQIILYSKYDLVDMSNDDPFQEMFPANYDKSKRCFNLDAGGISIPIYEDSLEIENSTTVTLPLFRKVLFSDSAYPVGSLSSLSVPLIAFHSYKGGVGRTLSLLAYVKAWSELAQEQVNSKLLIIDADIEAPGLTWLQDESFEDSFSYLDLLSVIQDNADVDTIVNYVYDKVRANSISIGTSSRTVEHFFIPTYRYKEQLLDLYASPESIVYGKDKNYILADVISKLAEKLGANAAVIDLRAGISEYSATLLLDPRIKKYLVSSTSLQSIKGTQLILECMLKGLKPQENYPQPEIFLNMIPDTLGKDACDSLISELIGSYEQIITGDSIILPDTIVTPLPFASELIHLTSLQQIVGALEDRKLYHTIKEKVDQNYFSETTLVEKNTQDEDRDSILNSIHALAEAQLTAEGNDSFNLLMTAPLKYLSKKYSDSIPATVILGAKGSGKTFLYRKLIEAHNWTSFVGNLEGNASKKQEDGFFIPVIAPQNVNEMAISLKECINVNRNKVSGMKTGETVFIDNKRKLEDYGSIDKWFVLWEQLLASAFDAAMNTLEEVNTALKQCHKKIIFLIDGLEEIFRNVASNDIEQKAIRSLVQDIITDISIRYTNIGIIVFLRKDLAHNAITVNFEQFMQEYHRAELKWSHDEALRLAVWLVSQAYPEFYNEKVEIDSASATIINKYLIKLWGLKLGKPSSNEAYSSRWILAALSDFNGQLQARDIIRFLKYATIAERKFAPYSDRLIMPLEIKEAVSKSSTDKIDEVKAEYDALKPTLEKLAQLAPDQKVLPLKMEYLQLTSTEEKNMTQEGFLTKKDGKYYLPEIIRHALDFHYEKGARPKVVSMLVKR